MKKIVLCLVCVGMSLTVSAQESMPKHELYGGAGLLNDNQVMAMVADVVGTIFTGGHLVQPDSYQILTPFIGYRHWITKRFGLGGTFAYDVNSVKVYNGTDENRSAQMKKINRYYMTFAVEPTFNYIQKPSFQLYGSLGVGATIVSFENTTFDDGTNADVSRLPYVNAHITPIGMRFGKDFGGFMEIGYGYKGIFNAGISYRF